VTIPDRANGPTCPLVSHFIRAFPPPTRFVPTCKSICASSSTTTSTRLPSRRSHLLAGPNRRRRETKRTRAPTTFHPLSLLLQVARQMMKLPRTAEAHHYLLDTLLKVHHVKFNSIRLVAQVVRTHRRKPCSHSDAGLDTTMIRGVNF